MVKLIVNHGIAIFLFILIVVNQTNLISSLCITSTPCGRLTRSRCSAFNSNESTYIWSTYAQTCKCCTTDHEDDQSTDDRPSTIKTLLENIVTSSKVKNQRK